MSVDLGVPRVHGIGGDLHAVDDMIPQECADRSRPVGCTDDRDRPREEDARHGPGVGTMLAAFDAVEVLVGRLDVPVEVDHAGIEAALQRPSGLGEHGEHRPVVAEHLCGEPLDPVRPGERGQVFE